LVKVWRVILAALVIFSAGVVTGALTVKLNSQPVIPSKTATNSTSQRQRGDLAARMERELGLTADQKTEIDQILRESRERSKKIWESAAEENRKLRESIRGVLTADQRKQFEETFKSRGPHKSSDPKSKEDARKPEDRRNQTPSESPKSLVPQSPPGANR
jgi:Spy/CpxP family protein refolding chaperone